MFGLFEIFPRREGERACSRRRPRVGCRARAVGARARRGRRNGQQRHRRMPDARSGQIQQASGRRGAKNRVERLDRHCTQQAARAKRLTPGSEREHKQRSHIAIARASQAIGTDIRACMDGFEFRGTAGEVRTGGSRLGHHGPFKSRQRAGYGLGFRLQFLITESVCLLYSGQSFFFLPRSASVTTASSVRVGRFHAGSGCPSRSICRRSSVRISH